MITITDISARIAGRLLLDHASVALPSGTKAGLVGRNGAGKSTLFRILTGELAPESGSISIPKNARIGQVAQEAPGTDDSLIEIVLAADKERAALIAEAETATDPHRIAEIQIRLADIDAHSAEARAASILAGLGFNEAAGSVPPKAFPAAGGCAWRSPPCCLPSRTCCCSTSRPTISTLKARCGSRITSSATRTPSSSSA
jgi:ATP-binding cassette subfamily F protein 3